VALSGGVNLLFNPDPTIALNKAMSPDGRCRAFDERASGMVRSEGCGMLVLKRLSKAQADGDRILALLRGTAINQDGRSGGLTVPNGGAQEAVVASALASARIHPQDVAYVECHGTGTILGDPIEVQALAAVFGEGREGNPLKIGSVKSNIGHTEAAAGVASLIKAVLALQHEEIPGNLHYRVPNPHIP
jgi:acyl transferase domain-containing protein